MAKTAPKLIVGQKLWCVSDRRSRHGQDQGREIEVKKVGRKWAETNWCRVDMATMRMEGFGDEYCYLSREDYERQCRLQAVWKQFFDGVSRQGVWRPPEVPIEDIQQAARLVLQRELEAD